MSATVLRDRFSFTLPRSLVDRLEQVAEREDRSKSGMLRVLLTRALNNELESAGGPPLSNTVAHASTVSAPGSGSHGHVEPGAVLSATTDQEATTMTTDERAIHRQREGWAADCAARHDAALTRQRTVKDEQEAALRQRRAEAVADSLEGLRRISK